MRLVSTMVNSAGWVGEANCTTVAADAITEDPKGAVKLHTAWIAYQNGAERVDFTEGAKRASAAADRRSRRF